MTPYMKGVLVGLILGFLAGGFAVSLLDLWTELKNISRKGR